MPSGCARSACARPGKMIPPYHTPVVNSRNAARIRRQQRRNPPELLIAQPKLIRHSSAPTVWKLESDQRRIIKTIYGSGAWSGPSRGAIGTQSTRTRSGSEAPRAQNRPKCWKVTGIAMWNSWKSGGEGGMLVPRQWPSQPLCMAITHDPWIFRAPANA